MSLVPTPELQDCWNQVGVQGDASCPRLAEFSHCRNCPVYASAAARLLHGEPPAEYLREWSERLAKPPPAAVLVKTHAAMIFRIGAEWLALPAETLQEVAEPRPVHSLPHRRGKVLEGLVNIRGELVICISLAGVLGIEERGDAHRRADKRQLVIYERLLVVATPGGRLAFTVAEVHGIEAYAPTDMLPVPETLALAAARYTGGILFWQKRSVGCLEPDALFAAINRSLG